MDRQDTPALPMLLRSTVKPTIAFHQLTLVLLTYALHGSLGIRIINCNNNKVEMFEDSPAPVTCGDITSTEYVYWRRGDGVYIGECSAAGTCTSDLYNDYRLSRSPQSTESQLTLVPDYRRHVGLTVTCWDRLRGTTASCTLVIRHFSSSALAAVGPIVGVIVAVIVFAIVAIFLRRKKQKSKKVPEESAQFQREMDDVIKEPQPYNHLTPPADNHGYEDLRNRSTTEDATTRTLSAANMYENTLRLAEKTYDTTTTSSDEHYYTEIKVKATRGVKATPTDLPDREEGDGEVYNIVS